MAAVTIPEALRLQASACANLGSPVYARLLASLADQWSEPIAQVLRGLLDDRFERPVHDAAVLRLAGATHRIALRGDAPQLARFYPSAGGSDPGDPTAAFMSTVAEHRCEIDAELDQQVQTNEVGRAALLVPGFCLLARRWAGRPLELYELGASAGLNLRWDRYRFVSHGEVGDAASELVFRDMWDGRVRLGSVSIASRHGCDISPLDAADPGCRLRLLSFVWPDQHQRFERLRRALEIAARHPVTIDQADAGAWLSQMLPARSESRGAVVFHSIVWQYLPDATKQAVRRALADAGARASHDRPLAWLRMEPAGPVADLRLTTWPSGREEVLATGSYHGAAIRWTAIG